MHARAWYQAGLAAPWLAILMVAPAFADWGAGFAYPTGPYGGYNNGYGYGSPYNGYNGGYGANNSFMASLARQAARQLIIYELRKLNSPKRSSRPESASSRSNASHHSANSNGQSYNDTRHGHSSGTGSSPYKVGTVKDDPSGLRYPTEDKFVPPPPPTIPVVYPSSPVASGSHSKSPAGASPLVPPPPPAPSIWDDSSSGEQPVVSKR